MHPVHNIRKQGNTSLYISRLSLALLSKSKKLLFCLLWGYPAPYSYYTYFRHPVKNIRKCVFLYLFSRLPLLRRVVWRCSVPLCYPVLEPTAFAVELVPWGKKRVSCTRVTLSSRKRANKLFSECAALSGQNEQSAGVLMTKVGWVILRNIGVRIVVSNHRL